MGGVDGYRWALGLCVAGLVACSSDPDASENTGGSSGTSPETTAAVTTTDASTSGLTESTSGAVDESSSSEGGESTEEPESSENADACENATMRPKPNDTSVRGPWPVGAQTVTIDDLTVEVFYPAGAEPEGDPPRYDIRDALPPEEAAKISDEDNPWQPCDCGRDLPIDDAYGPYPVVLFVHGTAGWRTQSLRHMTHWASRGFIVLTADHPGLMLRDILGSVCGGDPPPRDLQGDLEAMLAAVRGETNELAAWSRVIDSSRIGMSGHSAGGGAIAPFQDDAQVIMPLAAGPTIAAGETRESTLIMGGLADSVVPYASMRDGYDGSAAPKRILGLMNAGHLAFSEICSAENASGQNLLEIANEAGVCGASAAGFLFQCSDELLPDPEGWEITEYATSAALEETLHCSSVGTDNLATIQTRFPTVVESLAE